MTKKVLVVGGGTAGWITALFLQNKNPALKIELIESEEIGIVGAGESAPMSFNVLLENVGIDHDEFIKETESTIKSSVRFDSWIYSDDMYLNPIHPHVKNIYPFSHEEFPDLSKDNVGDFYLYCQIYNKDINSVGINRFNLANKAPYVRINGVNAQITGHTLHINAKLAAKYLRKIAERRGIIRHEGKIVKINGMYPIESVEDNRGNVHKFDIVFDCSGFARLIIGKHLKAEWIDYSKNLTVNSAIPFFLPMDREIPPYTKATAMKYGWMFKVPTKNRYGSGYVYNSDLISKEEAIKEVQEKLGHDVELVNHFNFRGGIYKQSFLSNCIALGLAAGFLEPMAATNLGSIAVGLGTLYQSGFLRQMHLIEDYFNYDKKFVEIFDQHIQMFAEHRVCEIFMHYITNRTDTKFWEHYSNKDNWPLLFRTAYEESFSDDKFDWRRFCHIIGLPGHTAIPKIIGNKWFPQRTLEYCEKYQIKERYAPIYDHIKQQTDLLFRLAIDHRKYLESL